MPVNVVDINLSAATGATPQPTYNDVVVFGHSTSEPSIGYNTPTTYTSASDVASDFSDGADVHVASQALEEMGVQEWDVVAVQENTVTAEVLGDSDSSSTDSGTVADAPIHDDASTVSVSLDGTDQTVEFVTDSPPDANSSPSSGEAYVNTDTGEVATGDTTSGTGAGIEVDYHYLSWSDAFGVTDPKGYDLFLLADTRMQEQHVGNMSTLLSNASSNDAALVAAHMNGNDATDESAAMETAHAVGGYLSSGDALTVAHKSSEDVAAYVTGQLATNRPWFDPFWDGDGYPLNTGLYSRSLVGDPSTTGTFEGGDTNGEGPANVIISVDGTLVLSNSLTTAGASSNYQYFDVGRTEAFLAKEAEEALKSLRLRQDQIPYTKAGRASILGAIRSRLQQYVGQSGDPLSELDVTAPTIDQISDDDKANRIFPNISITGTLAGNVHTFNVDMNIRV